MPRCRDDSRSGDLAPERRFVARRGVITVMYNENTTAGLGRTERSPIGEPAVTMVRRRSSVGYPRSRSVDTPPPNSRSNGSGEAAYCIPTGTPPPPDGWPESLPPGRSDCRRWNRAHKPLVTALENRVRDRRLESSNRWRQNGYDHRGSGWDRSDEGERRDAVVSLGDRGCRNRSSPAPIGVM